MKSLFRYPGAKTKLLPIILPRLSLEGEACFTDAFVGGGSVALAVASRYPRMHFRLNDLDTTVASFWALVATGFPDQDAEMLSLLRTPATIDRFYHLRETQPTSVVDHAYRAVFFNRTTFSGIAKASPIGGRNQASKWSVACRYNAEKLCASYIQTVSLLRGRATVTCLDVCALLNSSVESGSIYLDPPYYKQGRSLYSVYMQPSEHVDLARSLQSKAGWLLSYDDTPEIRTLYSWAHVEDIPARYCVRGKKEKLAGWVGRTELLIRP